MARDPSTKKLGDGDTDVTKLVGDRHPHFLTELRKPIIAAVNGACVGIGLTHALMCDVRFAAAGAKFATAFTRRGLIAEYGISWILPRLAGWGAAMDLLLSGRTFFAEEAAELGLVKDVVAPEQLMSRALAYADDIARNCSPASLAVIKRQAYGDAARRRRCQRPRRNTHARVAAAARRCRRHHQLPGEAATAVPAIGHLTSRKGTS